MNVENINKLADLLENLPDKGEFDMRQYNHECGAPACMAGWATAMAIQDFKTEVPNTFKTAQDFLGLDYETAYQLFLPDSYSTAIYREAAEKLSDDDFHDMYYNFDFDGYGINNKQAAAILRHLAKAGEVDFGQAQPERIVEFRKKYFGDTTE